MMKNEVTEAGSIPATKDVLDEKHALGQGTNDSTTTVSTGEEDRKFAGLRDNEYARSIWNFVTWTPKRCRWDPESPPKFSVGLNILFAFVSFVFVTFNRFSLTVKLTA